MKKTVIICSIILALLVCAGTVSSVFFGLAAMKKSDEVKKDVGGLAAKVDEIAKNSGIWNDVAQENDVTIAGEYVIKSTENISDAYKSGKTDGLSDKEKETLDMASEILDGIIEDGMDDYEKEIAVYDWMTANLENDGGMFTVIPTTQADCDNPYGVLKYHNAVCVGYATTFRLFMQMLDIPCKVVHNSEMYHSWDLVNLGGHWYHTDIYSDVGSGNYTHFNRTDDMVAGDQSWNRDYFPAADSYEYCYIYREAVETDDIYTVPAALRELIDGDKTTAAFIFKGGLDNADAALVEEMLNTLSSLVSSDGYDEYTYLSWNWSAAGDDYLLAVNYVTETWDEPDIPDYIDDSAREKMKKALSKAFGDIYDIDDAEWGGSWDYGSYYDYSWDGMFDVPTDEDLAEWAERYRTFEKDQYGAAEDDVKYIRVDRWYGTFGGMQVLMFGGFGVPGVEREETVAGSTLRFYDGRSIVVMNGLEFLTLEEAYDIGLLDSKQIEMIAEIQNHGYYMEVAK